MLDLKVVCVCVCVCLINRNKHSICCQLKQTPRDTGLCAQAKKKKKSNHWTILILYISLREILFSFFFSGCFMDNEQIYGSTVATFAQNDLHPHTISGGHIPQCWMNVFSSYWSVPAVIGWHWMDWLVRSSKLAVFCFCFFCFFAKTDLIQVQRLHNLKSASTQQPKV